MAALGSLILVSTPPLLAEPPEDDPQVEFAQRRVAVLKKIPNSILILWGAHESLQPIKFRQAPDFYYLTGIEEPNAILVLMGKWQRAYLFVAPRTAAQRKLLGPGLLDASPPRKIPGLAVRPLEHFFTQMVPMVRQVNTVYLQLSNQDSVQKSRREVMEHLTALAQHPAVALDHPTAQIVEALRAMKPTLGFKDANPLLDTMRWIKSPREIALHRVSSRIAATAVREAIKGTRPGQYEYEMEATARFVATLLGARGLAYVPTVASGANALIWHYSANDDRLREGDLVTMDFGVDYHYYTSDVTRTWPVSGRFTPRQAALYQCLLEVREAIFGALKPGATLSDLQNAAEAVYTRHGFREAFLRLGRYVGHFVGISVHDTGDLQERGGAVATFVPGVVFNVEPILELPEEKLHLRLEDTALVTAEGAECLSADVPVAIDALSALIAQPRLASADQWPLGPATPILENVAASR
jgi:Xaa-Pro aminopeptidase